MTAHSIIIQPLQTEKTTVMKDEKVYCFQVHLQANKLQIISAIKELFSVQPITCNTILVKGKPRRVRNKAGYTSKIKKAYIRIPPNESIQIFEGAQ